MEREVGVEGVRKSYRAVFKEETKSKWDEFSSGIDLFSYRFAEWLCELIKFFSCVFLKGDLHLVLVWTAAV